MTLQERMYSLTSDDTLIPRELTTEEELTPLTPQRMLDEFDYILDESIDDYLCNLVDSDGYRNFVLNKYPELKDDLIEYGCYDEGWWDIGDINQVIMYYEKHEEFGETEEDTIKAYSFLCDFINLDKSTLIEFNKILINLKELSV